MPKNVRKLWKLRLSLNDLLKNYRRSSFPSDFSRLQGKLGNTVCMLSSIAGDVPIEEGAKMMRYLFEYCQGLEVSDFVDCKLVKGTNEHGPGIKVIIQSPSGKKMANVLRKKGLPARRQSITVHLPLIKSD